MTPTEKAEAYCDQPRCAEMSRSDKAWHRTKAAWLDGHTEGRREALEMAEGLVEAAAEAAYWLRNAKFTAPQAEQKACDAWVKLSTFLIKFEAWREGK